MRAYICMHMYIYTRTHTHVSIYNLRIHMQVIGVQGLRVADGSVMPEIVSAHTNIPIYMIAEKSADMIKEEWGYSDKSRT